MNEFCRDTLGICFRFTEEEGENLFGLHLALVSWVVLYLEEVMGALRSSFHILAVQSPTERRYFGKNGAEVRRTGKMPLLAKRAMDPELRRENVKVLLFEDFEEA